MAEEKTRILLTNDDGIHSEGIAALEQALSVLGEV
ncbi:MAG: 5'/3'-nucleotidase SurE, partial [Candidatus Binatia bacterium]